MDLAELIAGLPVRASSRSGAPPSGVRICDITDDSRTVLPGSLFIARTGSKVDSTQFVPDAIAAGAAAVLMDRDALDSHDRWRIPILIADDLPPVAAHIAERFYGHPTSSLLLIGITGTNGKTTTAHLVHQILCNSGLRCGLIGTVLIDDGVSVGPATLTTPPAIELSRTFNVMLEAGCRAAVMETSSHALQQGRVAALQYNIAIFTNLTGDHLDYHGTMDAYAEAKARLFAMLPENGWAIVNDEDPWVPRMLRDCRAQILRCRINEHGQPPPTDSTARHATATIRSMSLRGTEVSLHGPWGRFDLTLRLVGRHNVMNALQAIAACWATGADMHAIARAAPHALPPPGRLEPVTGPRDPFSILVDYAHTDDALRKVMAAIQPLIPRPGSPADADSADPIGGRLCLVFGCGGDRDRTKRPRMGAAAAEMADVVFVTSDNPRTERPSDIIDDILAGIPPIDRHKVHIEVDRRRAIRKAVEQAIPGDVILIAGKGHETDQIVSDGRGGTIRHHFDDREVAREALVELREAGKAAR